MGAGKVKEKRGEAMGSKEMRGEGVVERLSAPCPEPALANIRYH